MEVLAKTPGLYQLLKLRNTTTTTATTTTTTTWDHRGDPGGGPRENPRSLLSPKAEEFATEKLWTDRPTDRHGNVYYPLVADKKN